MRCGIFDNLFVNMFGIIISTGHYMSININTHTHTNAAHRLPHSQAQPLENKLLLEVILLFDHMLRPLGIKCTHESSMKTLNWGFMVRDKDYRTPTIYEYVRWCIRISVLCNWIRYAVWFMPGFICRHNGFEWFPFTLPKSFARKISCSFFLFENVPIWRCSTMYLCGGCRRMLNLETKFNAKCSRPCSWSFIAHSTRNATVFSFVKCNYWLNLGSHKATTIIKPPPPYTWVPPGN